jgi:hypothetical protein
MSLSASGVEGAGYDNEFVVPEYLLFVALLTNNVVGVSDDRFRVPGRGVDYL